MNNLSGKLIQTAGALGLAVAALTTLAVSPAAAGTAATAGCTKAFRFDNVQVEADNCSDGWVWIKVGDGTYYKGSVRATDEFGSEKTELAVDQGKDVATKYIGKIKSIKICGTKYLGWAPPRPFWTYCSNQINVY
ncbi:hypothetical protein ACIRS1_37300 [Kitasatospora sp. NPDC101176]|uniref:hypothetical protein n=1 Tax=Kitasatospora sp. NPDC101176 TaxID=3364099 RepID=UPI0037FFA2EE